MVRYLLFSFAFMLTHCILFTKSANAEDASAATEVLGNCTFTNSLAGQLATNLEGTVLSSSIDGGEPASVVIDCTSDAILTISKPVQNAGATKFDVKNLSASATSTELPDIDVKSGEGGDKISADTFGKIIVNMEANNNGAKILPGQYNFTVTLTATP